MAWVGIGEEIPVKDENGARPEFEESGEPRESEFVAYEPMAGIELNLNDMASVSDRRWLETVLSNMATRRGLSTLGAVDFEAIFIEVLAKFVQSVRHTESGKTYEGREGRELLQEMCERDDVFALLFTLKRQCEFAQSKKKNWNSRFGLPTE